MKSKHLPGGDHSSQHRILEFDPIHQFSTLLAFRKALWISCSTSLHSISAEMWADMGLSEAENASRETKAMTAEANNKPSRLEIKGSQRTKQVI